MMNLTLEHLQMVRLCLHECYKLCPYFKELANMVNNKPYIYIKYRYVLLLYMLVYIRTYIFTAVIMRYYTLL